MQQFFKKIRAPFFMVLLLAFFTIAESSNARAQKSQTPHSDGHPDGSHPATIGRSDEMSVSDAAVDYFDGGRATTTIMKVSGFVAGRPVPPGFGSSISAVGR